VEDLNLEEVKQLVNFYRQKASELEFSNLQWQIKYNRLLSNKQQVSTAKTTKNKSE